MFGAFYVSPDNEYIGLKRIVPSQIADLPFMIAGPPKYYCHYGSEILIFPLPTATENTQEVKLFYAMRTTAATQALRIADVPATHKPLIYMYAASMAFRKEHRFAAADAMYGQYLNQLNALKQELYNVRPEIRTQ